jgi:hypothetical protein
MKELVAMVLALAGLWKALLLGHPKPAYQNLDSAPPQESTSATATGT